jgi:hypothetical protein
MKKAKKDRVLILPTYLTAMEMDISAHICPISVKNELQYIFPNVCLDEVIAIITMQKAQYELVNWGNDIEIEKDIKLERFTAFAESFCQSLSQETYDWIDYIDPCSGLPMKDKSLSKPYSEVNGAEAMLGYG